MNMKRIVIEYYNYVLYKDLFTQSIDKYRALLVSGKYKVIVGGKPYLCNVSNFDNEYLTVTSKYKYPINYKIILLYRKFLFFSSRFNVKNEKNLWQGTVLLPTNDGSIKIINTKCNIMRTYMTPDRLGKYKKVTNIFKNYFNLTIIDWGKDYIEERFISNTPRDKWNKDDLYFVYLSMLNSYNNYLSGNISEKNIKIRELFADAEKIMRSELYSELKGWFNETEMNIDIPQIILHGDMQFRNILLENDKLYIIDWESSRIGSVYYDMFFPMFFDELCEVDSYILKDALCEDNIIHNKIIEILKIYPSIKSLSFRQLIILCIIEFYIYEYKLKKIALDCSKECCPQNNVKSIEKKVIKLLNVIYEQDYKNEKNKKSYKKDILSSVYNLHQITKQSKE
jgi:thiamine kinase-like enzyme